MNRLLATLVALCTLAVSSSAAADADIDLTGSYQIAKGQNPDKSKYAGTVTMRRSMGLDTSYKVTWQVDGQAARVGRGLQIGNELWVAYGGAEYGGSTYGVGYYDPSAAGLAYTDFQGWGDLSNHQITGVAKVAPVANAKITGGAEGTISITQAAKSPAYGLTWKLPGRELHGIAVPSGNRLLVGWGAAPSPVGIVVYKVSGKAGKQKLAGKLIQDAIFERVRVFEQIR